MVDLTLLFEDIDPMDFLGADYKKLDVMKEAFPQIKFTSRGSLLKLHGEKEFLDSFKEKFELEQLDKRIPELENEKKILEEKLTVTSVHNELIQLSERLGQISTELDEKSLRWLELQDKAERTG